MDLRTLSSKDSAEQIRERQKLIEQELGINLSTLAVDSDRLGSANEKNCEQMFGHVRVPVGLAGPLAIHFSSDEKKSIYLPLATTEGALVASINRGCKSASISGVHTQSRLCGVTRSMAFKTSEKKQLLDLIMQEREAWRSVGEKTSDHLQIIGYDIDEEDAYVFLTIYGDSDLAMGMNMITVAAQAIGQWIVERSDARLITIAANIDSDKKPSARTAKKGRGWMVEADCTVSAGTLRDVLKTDASSLLETYKAKIEIGSRIAGALAGNCHSANIVAAMYLATGQDIAHTVEGSLVETSLHAHGEDIHISVRCPALLAGTIGGGTALPSQKAALSILLREETSLKPTQQLAETIGAAVLAGEISLLAALSTQDLATAHRKLAR